MIDLRSDTITRPTEAMLESMREASLGDDSRDGDATVQRLEALAAERMGKEAAAFMPGGAVLPLEHMRAVRDTASAHAVPVHVDGARIFNAAAHLGVAASEIGRHADSICFCVSKGLSAPVGSLLCGSGAFIERARAFRR